VAWTCNLVQVVATKHEPRALRIGHHVKSSTRTIARWVQLVPIDEVKLPSNGKETFYSARPCGEARMLVASATTTYPPEYLSLRPEREQLLADKMSSPSPPDEFPPPDVNREVVVPPRSVAIAEQIIGVIFHLEAGPEIPDCSSYYAVVRVWDIDRKKVFIGSHKVVRHKVHNRPCGEDANESPTVCYEIVLYPEVQGYFNLEFELRKTEPNDDPTGQDAQKPIQRSSLYLIHIQEKGTQIQRPVRSMLIYTVEDSGTKLARKP